MHNKERKKATDLREDQSFYVMFSVAKNRRKKERLERVSRILKESFEGGCPLFILI